MTVFIAQLKREIQVRYPRIKFLGKDFRFYFFYFFYYIYIYIYILLYILYECFKISLSRTIVLIFLITISSSDFLQIKTMFLRNLVMLTYWVLTNC